MQRIRTFVSCGAVVTKILQRTSVGAVLDHLENNEGLIQDYGDWDGFRPANRSGKSWSSSQFTVATRTVSGIKSPTLVAIGKGGKILSRDADLIIADDIEDHGTTVQPSARKHKKLVDHNVTVKKRRTYRYGRYRITATLTIYTITS